MTQAEYNKKNRRRHELIDRRVDGGLSAEEEAEFQVLQRECLEHTRRKFPLPPLDPAWRRFKETGETPTCDS